jgi:pimeloyl-ACP methyl ester carboxylesterase
MTSRRRPSITFVHGIWADGSSFNKLIPTLQAEGYECIAAQYGLDTLASDVASVKHTLARVSNPTILVGHSYGGTLITHAGTDPRVAGLVYVAALAPDADETSQSLLAKFPTTEIFSHVEVGDGRLWMKPDGIEYFAGDLSQEEQKLVWAAHAAPALQLFTDKVEGVAWKSKPSWYIVAKQDRTIQPDCERFVAKRMGATTFEIESSHVPMLSHPEFVLDVIRKAAAAIHVGEAA